jgi:hypothetical protein
MTAKFLQFIFAKMNPNTEIVVEVGGKFFTINHVREDVDGRSVIVLKEN